MLSFVLSGFVLLLVSFVITRLRADEDYEEHQLEACLWYRTARRCAPKGTSNPVKFWRTTLLQFVLGLSNQLLISGPLLILVALIRYMSTRDWMNLQTAIHASFFSVVSHLVSMQVLVPYLKERGVLAYNRYAVTGVNLILIFSSTAFFVESYQPNLPANRYIANSLNTQLYFTTYAMLLSIWLLPACLFSTMVQIHASSGAVDAFNTAIMLFYHHRHGPSRTDQTDGW